MEPGNQIFAVITAMKFQVFLEDFERAGDENEILQEMCNAGYSSRDTI